MSALKSVSPERAAELIRAGAVLVDIREADEHARERIPGARHHALSRIDHDHPARPGDDVLIFHCRSGARTKGNAPSLPPLRPVPARLTSSKAVSMPGRKPACRSRSIAASPSTSCVRYRSVPAALC